MTETAPVRQREGSALDRYCLCESYARATERSALAGARWLGRADQEGAERDSAEAMRSALEHLPIDGQVVIGAGGDEDETLGRGQRGALGRSGVALTEAVAVERRALELPDRCGLRHPTLSNRSAPAASLAMPLKRSPDSLGRPLIPLPPRRIGLF